MSQYTKKELKELRKTNAMLDVYASKYHQKKKVVFVHNDSIEHKYFDETDLFIDPAHLCKKFLKRQAARIAGKLLRKGHSVETRFHYDYVRLKWAESGLIIKRRIVEDRNGNRVMY